MSKLVNREHIEAITTTELSGCIPEMELIAMNFKQRPDPQGRVISLIAELLSQKHGFDIKPKHLNGKKIWTRDLGNGSTEVYITFEYLRQNQGFRFFDDKEVMELLCLES